MTSTSIALIQSSGDLEKRSRRKEKAETKLSANMMITWTVTENMLAEMILRLTNFIKVSAVRVSLGSLSLITYLMILML